MKMIDSPTCSLCRNNEETIEHLFWKCPNTQQFLNKVKDKFQEISVSLNLDECKFILGIYPPNTADIIQFLMLVAKYYINICKGTHKHLTFLEYKINVQSILQSHKQIALENNRLQNFLETWAPFNNLFDINCSGGFRGGSGGSHEPPLGPNYFNFRGKFMKKIRQNVENEPPLDGSEPPFQKSWIRP